MGPGVTVISDRFGEMTRPSDFGYWWRKHRTDHSWMLPSEEFIEHHDDCVFIARFITLAHDARNASV